MLNRLTSFFRPKSPVVAKEAPASQTQATPHKSPKPVRRKASGIAAEYRDTFDFRDDMEALSKKNPDQVKVLDIGTSVQGRTISAMQVGTGPVGLVLSAQMHGCEWTGGEAAFGVAEQLLKNRPDLLDKVNVTIVPCANPDSNEVSRGVLNKYRSNVNGTDLARNFPVNWGKNEFTPKESCHELGGTGPAPLSEPESQALEKLTQPEGVKGWLDLHSHGEMLMYPKSERPETYTGLIADMQKAAPNYKEVKMEEYGDVTGTLADYCESKGILHVVGELGTSHQPKGDQKDATIQEGVALGMAFVESMAKDANIA